jgi:hypothetical protein
MKGSHITSDNQEANANFGEFVAEVQPYAFELLCSHGGMLKCMGVFVIFVSLSRNHQTGEGDLVPLVLLPPLCQLTKKASKQKFL